MKPPCLGGYSNQLCSGDAETLGILFLTHDTLFPSAEIVYESIVMSLEDHTVHPEYTDRLQALLAYFAKSSLITSMSHVASVRIDI